MASVLPKPDDISSPRTPKTITKPLSPIQPNRSPPPTRPPTLSKMSIETLLTQDEDELLAAVCTDSTTGLSLLATAALEKGKMRATASSDSPPSSDISPRSSVSTAEEESPATSAANLALEDIDSVNSDNYPASMTSSIKAHVYEGGLRYHAYKSGKYAFPNDEIEQNRDDMKHSMSLLLMQGEFFYAPMKERLEEGAEVLDLGTGTGIWAIELGDKYPNTTVTGIDLSPIQPNYVPENVHFFVDDFDEDWVDPDDKYDFIHIRNVMHSVTDTKALLSRVMRHLKPGGYIEIQDLDITPRSDDETLTPTTPYALRDYLKYMAAGLGVLGSEMHAIHKMPDELAQAGFEEIKKTTHKAPIGMWPKDKRLRLCGLFLRTAMMDGLRGVSQRPMAALGWTPLQIEMVLVNVRKALMDPKVHAYFTFHVVYARKPLLVGGSGSER
ncbi:S-adenosyl-L-methionine-dependent methyltransferase [Cercophora samala]|uniref:S-adenosyl-L-methionine-dependent methyltransferase n=1 Tax=Cercophora samala TaxID=330535 RepID=A0AA39ZCQ1_9PEZI|nr:S-adenosyl-L-methionine-dependent methyltransferase [Cercophora samala]